VNSWELPDAMALASPQEVQVITRRRDGTLRKPTTIWIVGEGRRVFIRSTNGPTADWYRWAISTGTGQIMASGKPHEVTFIPAEGADLATVDDALRSKYGQYASIVDHLQQVTPRSAILEVQPS